MEYRINVNNKFAAIETEEEEVDIDPLDTLKKLQDQIAAKKPVAKKVPAAATKSEKPKTTKPAQPTNKATNVKNQKGMCSCFDYTTFIHLSNLLFFYKNYPRFAYSC